MPLRWANHVGGASSAVGEQGTWVITRIVTGNDENFYLSVQLHDSKEIQDRGKFPTRNAAQLRALGSESAAQSQRAQPTGQA